MKRILTTIAVAAIAAPMAFSTTLWVCLSGCLALIAIAIIAAYQLTKSEQ